MKHSTFVLVSAGVDLTFFTEKQFWLGLNHDNIARLEFFKNPTVIR